MSSPFRLFPVVEDFVRPHLLPALIVMVLEVLRILMVFVVFISVVVIGYAAWTSL